MKIGKPAPFVLIVLVFLIGCSTAHRAPDEAVRLETLRQSNPGLYELERNLQKSDRLAMEAESDARRR